jgi:hypothetical protein
MKARSHQNYLGYKQYLCAECTPVPTLPPWQQQGREKNKFVFEKLKKFHLEL